MGGYGSGKCYWRTAKTTTDPLLFLDVRYLARNGYLAVPAGKTYAFSLAWTCRGEPSGTIGVHVTGAPDGMPAEIVLDYRTQANGGAWRDVREPIDLDYTPCHYGGERPWFRCPGCYGRKAVLRSVGGRFRCNACHRIAYSSTRESGTDRAYRRSQDARKKLGAEAGPVWHRPRKPKHMRWTTYERICRTFDDAELAMEIDLVRLVARCDRLGKRR